MRTTHSTARQLYVRRLYQQETKPLIERSVKLRQTENENIEIWKELNDSRKRISLLKRNITFLEEGKTPLFLLENFFLVSLIEAAISQIRGYFKEENLSLSLKHGEDYRAGGELVLSILTRHGLAESGSRFDDFCDQWWFNNLALAKGRLCIEIQFV